MVAHAASTAVAVAAVKVVAAKARRVSGRPVNVAPPASRASLCWLGLLLLILLAGCWCGPEREALRATKRAIRVWVECSQPAGVTTATWTRARLGIQESLDALEEP